MERFEIYPVSSPEEKIKPIVKPVKLFISLQNKQL